MISWISDPEYDDTKFNAWVDLLVTAILESSHNKQSSKLFIDIGACVGDITDIFLKHSQPQDQIWLFEPDPRCLPLLNKKYSAQKLISIFQQPMTDRPRLVDFFITPDGPGTSFINQSPVGIDPDLCVKITTESTCVDNLLIPNNVSIPIIKVDAESSDFLILQGAVNTIQQHRPVLLFEFSGKLNCDAYGYTPKDWILFFKSINYYLKVPWQGQDEKYIVQNFNKETSTLKNIIAIPNEIIL